jgi:hypothetical protein
MVESVLISTVDKLIIKIWKSITEGNTNGNLFNDFCELVNTLKVEAKHIGCNEISKNLAAISQKIYQEPVHYAKSLYNIYCNTLATLIEQYIKIIDAK